MEGFVRSHPNDVQSSSVPRFVIAWLGTVSHEFVLRRRTRRHAG